MMLSWRSHLRELRRAGQSWARSSSSSSSSVRESVRQRLQEGPSLHHFIAATANKLAHQPPLSGEQVSQPGRKVFIETYGCQMNVNDTEVAASILTSAGFRVAASVPEADVVLLMTCAIREGAESKVWDRLAALRTIRRRRGRWGKPLQIGVLGCMAERLKAQLIEKEQSVDVVCGPDAYRDLPRLLSAAESGHKGVNVQLSLEETYADVVPVRQCADSPSAYVSIMRGCDNMCTYCIVPFTRGRERSRPLASVVDEVRRLVDAGLREVVLLGQNVNSYRDLSSPASPASSAQLAAGFRTVYKPKTGGARFADLLAAVSAVHPELRVRFTSPHPKDFPDAVLQLISERPNICRCLHLPAQSGASAVLARMNRGYDRDAYLRLVARVRQLVPGVALTSDFIAGFCGETEEEHRETLTLMEAVRYNFVFCFPYSLREKTRAHRRLRDDVPEQVKRRRHRELTEAFRRLALAKNEEEIGRRQLVLVEGTSPRSEEQLRGRNDANIGVVFPLLPLHDSAGSQARIPRPGDYVEVEVTSCTSQTFQARPVRISSVQEFARG